MAVKELGEVHMIYVNLSTQLAVADFAIMNLTELNNAYGGTVVATCPMTADILTKAPINAKKAYYMWDLSFLLTAFDFEIYYEMLSDVQLIVRSESQQKIMKNLFGLNSQVVDTFNLEQICNSLS